MLFRFSLYGFLKNQRYFEPFLILLFLEKGLGFFEIGLLIAFRELVVNLFEIPSGAIADVYGRRRSMIVSFSAYIGSFLVFGRAEGVPLLFLAMFLYSIGEAFRTGTHKAMIFTWLRIHGRLQERTRVYGFTRSWSKIGSAVSVVLATCIVFASDSYAYVFYSAVIPYGFSLINFLGYPAELDGDHRHEVSVRQVFRHLFGAFRSAWRNAGLRRLVAESMGFEGVYHAVKDYLQPVIQSAAVSGLATWVVIGGFTETRRTALLIGAVYFVLHLLSAVASRRAHRLADALAGEDRAARWLWGAASIIFLALLLLGYVESTPGLIVSFVLLHVIQNFWRPILISRFDQHSQESEGATVLSIESQARRLATMAIAPALGWSIDFVKAHEAGGMLWPVGAVGLVVTLVFCALPSLAEQGGSTAAESK